jgi:Nuclease-related domain
VTPSLPEPLLGIAKGLALATLFNTPLIFLLQKVKAEHRAYRIAVDEAIRELPLRPPGESLRQRIETLTDEQDNQIVSLALSAYVSCAICLAAPVGIRAYMIGAGVCLFVLKVLSAMPKLLKKTRQKWSYQLRFVGEQLVAEELNQLLNSGYRVFHDVPCQGYNIDHVVVGPKGVFAVETNTRHRGKKKSKQAEPRVRYDGDTLFWPAGKETGPVDQALFNGRSLGHWLGSATGEPVPVQPIVTIPGWSTEDNQKHRVWLIRPQALRNIIESQQDSVLPDQIQRIAQHVSHRCRMDKAQLGG